MALRSSNPALARFGRSDAPNAGQQPSGYQPPTYQQPQDPYGTPAQPQAGGYGYGFGQPQPYGAPTGQPYGPPPGSPEHLQQMYGTQARVTLDDVVVKTLTLLAVLAVSAGAGWFVVSGQPQSITPVVLVPALLALVLSFVINRAVKVRPPLILAYAVLEGVAVGAISSLYESLYSGIVLQALIGTFAIFALMLTLHRTGVLRATPKMARIVSGAIGGILIMYLVDIALYAFGGPQLPLVNSASPLGILLSLAIVVVASLTFTLDFGMIEQGIAAGVPQDESWRMGFGLLVSFVWVYLELLRLLSKLQRR